MPKLTGTLRDGSPFEQSVNARTKRLRLYQHDLATLDLAALAAAPNLEICETGQNAIEIPSLAPLASCRALTNLSIAVPAGTDLSPLAACPALRALHLYIGGDAPCDLGWLAQLRTLESLSISQQGAPPPIDLSPLRELRVRSVSLSGITNARLDLDWVSPAFDGLYIGAAEQLAELDLAPLAGTRLRTFNLHTCRALEHLDLAPLAKLPLERIAFYEVWIKDLFLYPLAECPELHSLQLLHHATRTLDVTPLAPLAKLDDLDIDGKDAPVLAQHALGKLASPGVREWHRAGQLTIE